MASSILPNDRCTTLPILPTDGQRFVDAQMVQWIYNGREGIWERRGTTDDIPLANTISPGLLSPQDKNLIDGVPAIGGGFGIITDAKLLLKSPTNPEGVITGDITLKSDSLDIICVGPDKLKLTCVIPSTVLECVGSEPSSGSSLPGLLFKLSDKFLDTLIVDRRGPKGKKGLRGDKGSTGDPGFGDGQQGIKGIPGDNINELCSLDEIRYNDIDGITDTAIVNFDLVDNNGHGCKLIVTKAKINVEEDRPADKLIASNLIRSVVYEPDSDENSCDITRLDDWSLAAAGGDTTPLNLQLLRLPKSANETVDNPVGFNGTMALEDFVGQIVGEYKSRLTTIDSQWGKEVKQYINGLDDKARGILSDLANQLSMCEFNLPAVEYCITFTGCGQPSPPPPPPPPPPPSPLAAASMRAGMAPLIIGSNKVTTIGMGKRNWNVKL
mgnify:CR=1 FL=1